MNISQNSDFAIVSDSEAASIINRFTPEMVEDIVQEAIKTKYRSYSNTLANIVGALESNYRDAMAGLPEYSPDLMKQREDIYRYIIQITCQAHQLVYIPMEVEDIYSAAYYIYDFLLAKFNNYMINFFVNYINREKNTIYENLKLVEKKKDAPLYSKKIYKNANSKLAVIHANLEYVLQNIFVYDISFDKYIDLACIPDRTVSILKKYSY